MNSTPHERQARRLGSALSGIAGPVFQWRVEAGSDRLELGDWCLLEMPAPSSGNGAGMVLAVHQPPPREWIQFVARNCDREVLLVSEITWDGERSTRLVRRGVLTGAPRLEFGAPERETVG